MSTGDANENARCKQAFSQDFAIILNASEYQIFFFLHLFCGHISMSYFGGTGTPVLDFSLRLLWVSKPEWVLPYSHCGGACNEHSVRSTSGVTH